MRALRRLLPKLNLSDKDDEVPLEVLSQLKVTADDFEAALQETEPSSLREVFILHWVLARRHHTSTLFHRTPRFRISLITTHQWRNAMKHNKSINRTR